MGASAQSACCRYLHQQHNGASVVALDSPRRYQAQGYLDSESPAAKRLHDFVRSFALQNIESRAISVVFSQEEDALPPDTMIAHDGVGQYSRNAEGYHLDEVRILYEWEIARK